MGGAQPSPSLPPPPPISYVYLPCPLIPLITFPSPNTRDRMDLKAKISRSPCLAVLLAPSGAGSLCRGCRDFGGPLGVERAAPLPRDGSLPDPGLGAPPTTPLLFWAWVCATGPGPCPRASVHPMVSAVPSGLCSPVRAGPHSGASLCPGSSELRPRLGDGGDRETGLSLCPLRGAQASKGLYAVSLGTCSQGEELQE